MKLPLAFALVLVACAVPAVASVSGNFFSQLTAEERAAAGLDVLTEPQRAVLNLHADRWAADRSESLVRAARERAVAEVRAQLEHARRSEPGFDLAEPGTEPIRTRIVGDFSGWETGSTFRMENDQVWAVDGLVGRYTVTPRRAPRVDLKPDVAGVWHLHLVSESRAVRVKRLR